MMDMSKMTKPQQVAFALRCTASPGGECIGSTCPYYMIEHVKFDDYEGDWQSCDIDRIGFEAADLIEKAYVKKPRCGTCKWLSDEHCSIGNKCVHPERPFRVAEHNASRWKYKTAPACKRYEEAE